MTVFTPGCVFKNSFQSTICPVTGVELMRMPVPQRSTTYGGGRYLPLMKTRPLENNFPRVTPSALALAFGIG